MTNPIPLDVLETEFDDQKEAWVLQDVMSKQYVIVPDDRYPGRRPVRFFLRREDADALLREIRKQNKKLAKRKIEAMKVKLLPSLRAIAADTTPGQADTFVVHSPNEVFEFARDRR